MGYIQLSKGIADFSKIVISFWFRVPQASLDKADAAYSGEDGVPFDGIVPLLVIGERGTGDIPYSIERTQTKYYDVTAYVVQGGSTSTEMHDIGSGIFRRTTVYNPDATIVQQHGTINGPIDLLSIDGEAPPTDATFIGVDSGGRLFVSFQTNQKADVTGDFLKTSVTPGTSISHGLPITFGGPEHSAFLTGTSIEDFRIFPPYYNVVSDDTHWVFYPVQETVNVKFKANYTDISDTSYATTGVIYSNEISADPDKWHHVLVSVDLKTISTHGTANPATSYEAPLSRYVDGAAKLYVALDDVNYTEYDLSWLWNDGGDPNEVITEDALHIAGIVPNTDDDVVPFPTPTYDLSDPKVPASKKPLGVPARAEFVENIFRVEIAELQIFTDTMLDPADVKNRRVFVDRDGLPVPPLPKINPDDPEGEPLPPPAAKLIGKHPEILLTGAANWSAGYNTGTLGFSGVDDEGKPIVNPAGQFEPNGEILAWTPDPSLRGPQKLSPSIRLSKKPVAAE